MCVYMYVYVYNYILYKHEFILFSPLSFTKSIVDTDGDVVVAHRARQARQHASLCVQLHSCRQGSAGTICHHACAAGQRGVGRSIVDDVTTKRRCVLDGKFGRNKGKGIHDMQVDGFE